MNKRRECAALVILLSFIISGCQLTDRLPSISNPFGGDKDTVEEEVPQNIELTYWGLWEAEEVMRPVIEDYQNLYAQKNPGSTIQINYVRKPPSQYRDTLQSSIRAGEGPDIYRFHNTWVPMLREELAPLPQTIMSNTEYEEVFYQITKSDLLVGNSYVGIPVMFDGLALFYNEDHFEAAGISTPPNNWDELRTVAAQLAQRDPETDRLVRGGVAMGTANNVDHFSDILGLMMLQNNADPRDLTDGNAQDAFRFYTVFAVTDGVWNETMLPSTEAFATGQVSMMFGPSWRVHNVREANPELRFRTAPVPELPGSTATWASYWVEGVSSRSPYQAEAWDFLKFLSQPEQLRRMYTTAAKQPNRAFGEPYPRKDMADSLLNEPLVGAYIQQAPRARSWYLASRTFDNGINDRMIKAIEDAVNQVNRNGPYSSDEEHSSAVSTALKQAQQNAVNILSQYNIQIPG